MRLAVVVAIVSSRTGLVVAAPVGYAPITQKVCVSGSGAQTAANVLASLPRYDRRGTAISSDIGSYDIVACSGSNPTESNSLACSLVNPFDQAAFPNALNSAGAPGTVLQYAEGPALYGVLALAMALLSILFTACFIVGRYCCCCCPRDRCCCITCQFGGHEPTRRMCCCGVAPATPGRPRGSKSSKAAATDVAVAAPAEPATAAAAHENPMLTSPSATITSPASSTTAGSPTASVAAAAAHTSATPGAAAAAALPSAEPQEYVYPRAERCLTLILLLAFLGFLAALTSTGAALGLTAIPAGIKEVAPTLTRAYMPLVEAAYAQASSLIIDLSAQVAVPQALALNTTLQAGVSLGAIDASLGCILQGVDAVPTSAALLQPVRDMNASIVSLKASVRGLVRDVDGVIASRTPVSAAVAALHTTVTGLGASLGAVSASITGVDASVAPFLATQTQLQGMLPSLLTDIGRLDAGSAGGMPAPADITAVTGPTDPTDVTGDTLNALLGPSVGQPGLDGSPARLQALYTALAALNGSIATIVGGTNFSAAADRVMSLLSLADTVQRVYIPSILASIGGAEAALAALPASPAITAQVTTLDGAVQAVSFAGVLASLTAANASIAGIPSIPGLIGVLDQILRVQPVVPCAQDIAREVRRSNDTLVVLPDALNALFDGLDGINGTVQDAMGQVRDLQAKLRDANAQIAAVNISEYRAQAGSAWASLNASRASFNVPDVKARVGQLDVGVPVNFTSIRATLALLNRSVGNPGVNASTVDLLRRFQDLNAGVASNMPGVLSDLGAVKGGAGTYKCSDDDTTVCTVDSDCAGAGAYCMPNFTRAGDLRFSLWGMALTPAQFDAGSTVTALRAVQADVSSVNAAAMRADIASANASIGAIDTAGIQTQLATVQAAIGSYDTSSLTQTLNDLQGQLDAVDISAFQPQLDTIDSALSSIKGETRDLVAGVRALLQAGRRQLDVGLAAYAQTLSAPNLLALLQGQGAGSVIAAIAGVGQSVVDAFYAVNQSAFTLPAPRPDFTSKVDTDAINRATASGPVYLANRYAGWLQWAASSLPLGSAVTDKVVGTRDPSVKSVQRNTGGDKYPNAALCATDACIAATVDAVAYRPVEQSAGELGISLGSAGSRLYISPIAFVNLIWLFPAVVVVWGLLALCGRWICCRKPRWEKCLYGCMTGCVMCQLPLCFVLAAITFPLIMVTGDVCASGRNVAYSAALQVATQPAALAAVCAKAPATLHARPGPAGSWACGLSPSFDLPSGDTILLNASVSLPGYVGALLGQGRCGAGDPWAPIVNQAVSYVRTVPYSQMAALVGSAPAGAAAPLTGKQVVALRPPLWSVAAAATNATANVLADHLASAAAQLGSCTTLSAAVQSTSDAVCCSLFSPLYWMASIFYLIGWAYCCCGLPAGLLGRKRLVSRPWGPYADPTEAAAAAQKRAAAAARRQRGRSGGFVQPGGAGAAADAEAALAAKYAAAASADSGAGGYGSVDDAGVELTASETPPLTGQAAPAAGGAPPALGAGLHGLPAAQSAYGASAYAGHAAYAPVGLGSAAVPAGAYPAGAGAGPGGAHGLSSHPGGPSARRMGPWGKMNSIAVYRRPKEGLMRGRSVRGANGGGSPSRGEGAGGEDPSEGATVTPRPAAGPAAVNAAAAAAAAAAVVDSMGVGGRSSVLPPAPYSALNPLGMGGAPHAAALAGSPAGGAAGAAGGGGMPHRPFVGPITYSVPGGFAGVPTPAAPAYPGLYPSLPALHFAGTPGAAAALHAAMAGGNVDIDGGAFSAPSARPLPARPAADNRISLS